MSTDSKHPLSSLLKRVTDDPFFLGWAINRYALSYGMGKRAIATWLKCRNNAVDKLALCRLTNGADTHFAKQVKRIAEYVGCDRDRLAAMIREAVAVDVLAKANFRNGEGFLMAARDRREKDNDEKNK